MKQEIRISFLSVWILAFAAAYFKADVSLYKKGLPANLFRSGQ